MCGFVGILSDKNFSFRKFIIKKMLQKLYHRGPDAEGIFHEECISLAHKRLKIIDINQRSNQPLLDYRNNYVIVYNGEIYNYKSIKIQLIKLGYKFKTDSDTEVLLNAYIEWDVKCLNKIDGMFSFAIWHRASKTLFLSRDKCGEKPLYYSILPHNGIIFSSELTIFKYFQDLKLSLNRSAFNEYLQFGYIPTNKTIYKNINKLEPGTWLKINKNFELKKGNFWDLYQKLKNKKKLCFSLEEASEHLKYLIDKSVKKMSYANVPLGTFLSGGIDSSTITASLDLIKTKDKIKTFTVGFKQKSYDELQKALLISNYLKVENYNLILEKISDKRIIEIIEKLDEPFSDTSYLPAYELSKLAKSHAAVVLGGDGADELFGGYSTNYADILFNILKLPKSFYKLSSQILKLFPTSRDKVSLSFKMKQFAEGAKFDWPQCHFFWRQIHNQNSIENLIKPEFNKNTKETFFYEDFKDISSLNLFDQSFYIDFQTWLPNDILYKIDRASMASSLEVRSPFLDNEIINFAISLDPQIKFNLFNGTKIVLRESQKGRLPKSLLNETKKGFNAPYAHWFKNTSKNIKEILMTPLPQDPFNQKYINKVWNYHQKGFYDFHLQLLNILSFRIWGLNNIL